MEVELKRVGSGLLKTKTKIANNFLLVIIYSTGGPGLCNNSKLNLMFFIFYVYLF